MNKSPLLASLALALSALALPSCVHHSHREHVVVSNRTVQPVVVKKQPVVVKHQHVVKKVVKQPVIVKKKVVKEKRPSLRNDRYVKKHAPLKPQRVSKKSSFTKKVVVNKYSPVKKRKVANNKKSPKNERRVASRY